MKFNNLNSLLCIALTFLVGVNGASTTVKTPPSGITEKTTYSTTTTTIRVNPSTTTLTSTPAKKTSTNVIFTIGGQYRNYIEYTTTTLRVPETVKDVYGECTEKSRISYTKGLSKRDNPDSSTTRAFNTVTVTNNNYICNYVGDCYNKYGTFTYSYGNYDVSCTAYTHAGNVNEIKTIDYATVRNLCKPSFTKSTVKCSYATPTVSNSLEEENCSYLDYPPCISTKEAVVVNPREDGCNLGYEFGEYCLLKEDVVSSSDPHVQLVLQSNGRYDETVTLCPTNDCQPFYYYNGDLFASTLIDYGDGIKRCVCNNPSTPVDMTKIQRFNGIETSECRTIDHFEDIMMGRKCIINGGIFYYRPKEYKCQQNNFYCIMPSEPENENEEQYCLKRNGKNYCHCNKNRIQSSIPMDMEECRKSIEEENLIELNYTPAEEVQSTETVSIDPSSVKTTTSLTSTPTISNDDPSCPDLYQSMVEEKKKECLEKKGSHIYYKRNENYCGIDYACYINEPTTDKNEVNKRRYESNLPECQVDDSNLQEMNNCSHILSAFTNERLTIDDKYVYHNPGLKTVTFWNDDFSDYRMVRESYPPTITDAMGRCTYKTGSYPSQAKQVPLTTQVSSTNQVSSTKQVSTTVNYNTVYYIYDESKDKYYGLYLEHTTINSMYNFYPTTYTMCTTYTAIDPNKTRSNAVFFTVNHSTTTTTTTTSTIPVNVTTTTKIPPPSVSISTPTETVITTTTTTTTTTKTPPPTSATAESTDVTNSTCDPITQTITVKEETTVTEKETITVTVSKDSSSSGGGETPTVEQNCSKKWAQCGGQGYSGPTCCVEGTTCRELNKYYSQCV